MAKPTKSPVVKATVSRKQSAYKQTRAAADLVRRHQAALRAIDRLDAQRIVHPHIPQLANDVLRRDDAIDYNAPVIKAIIDKAGPKTGSHPMATRIDPPPARPMATRFRPHLLMEDERAVDRVTEYLTGAAGVLFLTGCVMLAVYLGNH